MGFGRKGVARAAVIFVVRAQDPKSKKQTENETKRNETKDESKQVVLCFDDLCKRIYIYFPLSRNYRGGHGRRETPFRSSTTSRTSSHAPTR